MSWPPAHGTQSWLSASGKFWLHAATTTAVASRALLLPSRQRSPLSRIVPSLASVHCWPAEPSQLATETWAPGDPLLCRQVPPAPEVNGPAGTVQAWLMLPEHDLRATGWPLTRLGAARHLPVATFTKALAATVERPAPAPTGSNSQCWPVDPLQVARARVELEAPRHLLPMISVLTLFGPPAAW